MKKAPARKRQLTRKKALIGKTGVRNRKPKLEKFPLTRAQTRLITLAAFEWLQLADIDTSRTKNLRNSLVDCIDRLDNWNSSRPMTFDT